METTPSTSDGTSEFYLPGTFQFARSPGRLERFLARRLWSRDGIDTGVYAPRVPEFSLPATPAVRHR